MKLKYLLLIVFLIFSISCEITETKPKVYVTKVIDGDTIVINLNNKKEKVRLIGIDAPELGQGQWGLKSKKYLESLIKDKFVSIEFDVQPTDKYNRLLAYIYLDNNFINALMLQNGYAMLYTVPPNVKYVDLLKEAQNKAKNNNLGIWDTNNGLKISPVEYRKKKKHNYY